MANKSQFRINIENAIKKAKVRRVLTAKRVFVDRNKCSDRIKFALRTADDKELKRIQTQVQNVYPNEQIKVYNADSFHSYGGYYGVAISVSHKDNVKL